MNISFKKYILLFVVWVCFLNTQGYGMDLSEQKQDWEKCALVIKKNGKVHVQKGKYEERRPPFSTFKVALALMGFNSGILESRDLPKWPFKQEYEQNFPNWYTQETGAKYNWFQDHTPATFMKNSVLWFSHQITERLGKTKFKEYVTNFDYGNTDVSGTPGKDDSLLNSWLGTSLKISPQEQITFLETLFVESPVVSKDAQDKTRSVMDREEEWNGWKLFGKTGGGTGGVGWFVGWIEQGPERIFFAQYIDLKDPGLDLKGLPIHQSTGLQAKEVVKVELLKLMK